MQDDIVEIADVEVLEVTPDALCISLDDGEFWVPFQEIAEHSEVGPESPVGTVGMLAVSIIWASDVLYSEHSLEDDDAS